MQKSVRGGFLYVLFAVVLFAGVYWYRVVDSKCKVPVVYSVGTIDERFAISKDEVRAALSDAESLWEDATGKNLFTYDEGAPFAINFVYDERQDATDKGEIAKVTLDDKQAMSEQIRADYERMVSEYEKLQQSYEANVSAYEKRLAEHNSAVEEWNRKGGAPEEVYERLNREQEVLAKENTTLNATARELNQLVNAVNKLGEKGNLAVQNYNQDVAWYNQLFGTEREFTQGDYQGDRITIYQFDNGDELRRVLAHEFGHALSLEHTEGEQSLMHYLLEGKNADFALSPADLAEYERVCGAK